MLAPQRGLIAIGKKIEPKFNLGYQHSHRKQGDMIVSKEKVLIVDDDVGVREMMELTLIADNYVVFAAEGAEKALEILIKENLMVMFLDLKLPGMSGIDLCRRIRKENKVAIIHAITGYSTHFTLLECREAGFDDYFIKPFDSNLLLKAAKEAFARLERWEVSPTLQYFKR